MVETVYCFAEDLSLAPVTRIRKSDTFSDIHRSLHWCAYHTHTHIHTHILTHTHTQTKHQSEPVFITNISNLYVALLKMKLQIIIHSNVLLQDNFWELKSDKYQPINHEAITLQYFFVIHRPICSKGSWHLC